MFDLTVSSKTTKKKDLPRG
nr:hypothetical protein [Sicyoidochytrium minutum DNA virus]